MAQETYDWSLDYADEDSGTTTTFTSVSGDTVDVTVAQPDPLGVYRTGRDGFETNTTMGGSNTGFFEAGVNFTNASQTVTQTISFANNTLSGANSVTDPSFTLFDIDSTTSATFQDQVTVLAFDAAGNPLTVTLTAIDPTVVTVSGATATAIPGAGSGPSGSVAASSTEGNVTVSITGEVASIQIVYGNGPLVQSNPANQAIGFGDLTFDLTPPVVCVTRGTRIRTPYGDVPVEALRVGDLVVTQDRGPQPLRWISGRKVKGQGAIAPVRFAPGTIGNTRELLVSPQHRMLLSGWKVEYYLGLDEVFAPAITLVDGKAVRQVARDRIEYFHFAFDRHEIVFAEGAACESLCLGQGTIRAMSTDQQRGLDAIFGDLSDQAAGAGKLARPCLKAFEARMFMGGRPDPLSLAAVERPAYAFAMT